VQLERRGIPTVTVGSHLFVRLGETERRALGMPELPMAITQHPIGGIKSDAVQARANALLPQVISGLIAGQAGSEVVTLNRPSGGEICPG
jgi:hypothetical protein